MFPKRGPDWTREQDAFLLEIIRQPKVPSGKEIAKTLNERFGCARTAGAVSCRLTDLRRSRRAQKPIPNTYKELIGRILHWHETGESTLPIRVDQEAKERIAWGVIREIQSR